MYHFIIDMIEFLKKYIFALILFSYPLIGQDFPNLPEPEDLPRSTFSREDSTNSLKDLKANIDELLNNDLLKSTDLSIAIYSLDQNDYIYQKNIYEAVTPASNTKLFTTFASLSIFGKKFYVSTVIYADAKPNKDSVLNGNLYIVGYGDGLLSVPDIEYLADDIKNSGIKKINGNVYADNSFFDELTDRMVYAGDADRVEGIPPITPLSIEKNVVQVLVRAGNNSGEKVSVQTIPASEAFKIDVTATVSGGSKGRLENNYRIESSPYDLPLEGMLTGYGGGAFLNISMLAAGKIYISSKLGSDGYQNLKVSGSLNAGRTYYYSYHILNPALAVAGSLKDRLISGGVPVNGSIGIKSISEIDSTKKPIYLSVFQRPLIELLMPINKNSDNYLAETLFKMIGGNAKLNDHTGKSAQQAIKNALKNNRIYCDKCQLNDGSGLSRRNLCTTDALVQILKAAANSDFASEFDSTLSIAGIDGTLEKRMTFGLAENNLRAKTGTLRNVSALSGYVNTLDGERLCFSFIFNGPNIGTYKEIEDQLGEILSQFFYYNIEN
jgi:D-alanyl-D-alanine carboxypeptidase/D-alanyl-D-alanine-endopeptidase (penicillin-binding protein 4)